MCFVSKSEISNGVNYQYELYELRLIYEYYQ